jgi:hypothetical protein
MDLGEAGTAIPGQQVAVVVELGKPVALDNGLGFVIREGGKTVGAGTVTAVRAPRKPRVGYGSLPLTPCRRAGLADHMERCGPAWVGPAVTPARSGVVPCQRPRFALPGWVRRRWHGGLGEAGLCAADFVAQVHGVLAPDDDGRGTATQDGIHQAGYACPAAPPGVLTGNIIKRWFCGAVGPGGLPGRCGVATCHGCPPE